MAFILATVLAVRGYKQHKADQGRLAFPPTPPNIDPEFYSEMELAYLAHQAGDPSYASRANQGCCGRSSRDCTTCGRVNASRCHQRKCYRRQYGGGCCGGSRRRARQLPIPNGIEVGAQAQEQGVPHYDDAERRDSGYQPADGKSAGGFTGSEKEIEAGYVGGYGSQGEKSGELPPYKG